MSQYYTGIDPNMNLEQTQQAVASRADELLLNSVPPGDQYSIVDNGDGTFTISNKYDPEDTYRWQPGMELPERAMKAMIEYLHAQFKSPDEVRDYSEQLSAAKEPAYGDGGGYGYGQSGRLFEKRTPDWVENRGGFQKRSFGDWLKGGGGLGSSEVDEDYLGHLRYLARAGHNIAPGMSKAAPPATQQSAPAVKQPYDLRNQPHYTDYL